MSEKGLHTLTGAQGDAADPGHSVWLSASAGTGKTQVLSARVLRLLMEPKVDPSAILCLTFTKAGAAEMATRVNETLARWVRAKPDALAADLKAIGAPVSPEAQAHARTLFTKVLDCPGGGLRIDTIHAFSQWLLAAFPEEAGLEPGTRPMEDRTRELLAREVLSDLVSKASEDDLSALSMLSLKLGPDGARSWLMACAGARDLWEGPAGWQAPLRPRVLQLLGLPSDLTEADIAARCADECFDIAALKGCLAHYGDWKAKSGADACAAISAWLAGDTAERFASLGALENALFFKNGNPRLPKNADPHFEAVHAEAGQAIAALQQVTALLALAEYLAPSLEIGRRFALAWEEAKRTRGLVDFDDQIARAARLLQKSDMSQWIAYKLDRRFDHILVDEAQDTNAAQWAIIDALADDFYDGHGQAGARTRTMFVVGDTKQAIFGFQGTQPELFVEKREHYRAKIDAAIANARKLADETRSPPPIALRPLADLSLGRNYRSAQSILDFVDDAVRAIGPETMGLDEREVSHEGEDRPGQVTLWQPIHASADDTAEAEEDGESEGWLPAPERRMADCIAKQVKQWLDEGHPLQRGKARLAEPKDIMILVRKRRALAGLIVGRLHAAGVPVAGVDRLRLGAPLAVQDLLAALRFAAQPRDDLSLANLLVSPLGGWSQDDLLTHGLRGKDVRLWDHLRESDAPEVVETVARLRDLLRRVDIEPPEALLQWMLTGPWDGRRKLVARLGREANDPIDELVGAAFAFSAEHTASLQGFLQWFDSSDEELKRDAGGQANVVRVMTAHGSKGLQAPIVILADATSNPDRLPARAGALETEDGRTVPVPRLPKEARVGPVEEAEEAKAKLEREEHWRLLYVAMTRAEEALYIGGALGLREDEPAEDSWYARVAPLFPQALLSDPIWGGLQHRGALPERPAKTDQSVGASAPPDLPEWIQQSAPAEPRPSKPLAPSGAGEDLAASPPLLAGDNIAAQRGTLIHKLLERLPDVPPTEREVKAASWLSVNASDFSNEEQSAILESAMDVLGHPEFGALFGSDALAEVALAATVEGDVITGTLDRLLVEEDRVLVVDYKTTRRPPGLASDVPNATLRQMAAYCAALEAIYPGRKIESAVLYTETPQLIALPAELLEPHKPGLGGIEESYVADGFARANRHPRYPVK